MLSHHASDEKIVLSVLKVLQEQSIPVWFDKNRETGDDITDR
jgi:hypothetical protein